MEKKKTKPRKSAKAAVKKHQHTWHWIRQYGIEPIDWVFGCQCGAEMTGEEMYA